MLKFEETSSDGSVCSILLLVFSCSWHAELKTHLWLNEYKDWPLGVVFMLDINCYSVSHDIVGGGPDLISRSNELFHVLGLVPLSMQKTKQTIVKKSFCSSYGCRVTCNLSSYK